MPRITPLLAVLSVFVNSALRAAPPEIESGFPNDPAFFPLAVWVQQPKLADRYKAIGINTYVALWRGPTEEHLELLEKSGMYVVCHQNPTALKHKNRKVIAAWMHGDEPDNAQRPRDGRKGWDPPIPPEKIIENYNRIKSNDPTRPVFLNLGQGVAWDMWYGRGVRKNHPEDYPEYLKGCDIASFDIYPVVHEKPEIAGKLEYVAHGVHRLRTWIDNKKPVWACIETTHIDNPPALPSPAQIRSEVWLAITHGATGILYFCHEFKPKPIEAGLLAHSDNAKAVKEINAQIKQLAPVLNSPTKPELAQVQSAIKEAPIALLPKAHEGATYLLTVNTRNTPTQATFTLPNLKGSTTVEVLGEDRTLTATDGVFQDNFTPYAVHHYRIQSR